MMISSFRRSLQNEEAGQAIILGVATMLVLAVGIMTTAQLGWAIKAKIQLQHAADNAAYSNATMVARSMNFIAWTNRAIVSQYVSAMAFQSMVTHLDGVVMVVAAAAASVLSASFVLGVIGRILEVIPFTAAVGVAMVELAQVLGKAGGVIEDIADNAQKIVNRVDSVVAPIVQSIGYINEYVNYWLMQQIMGKGYIYTNLFMAAAGSDSSFYKQALTGTAGEGVNGSDSNGVYDAVSSLLSGASYLELFDKNSEKIGKDRETTVKEIIRAEAMMTTIANASREGRKDMTFESKREFGIASVFGTLLHLLGGGGNFGWLGTVLDLFNSFFAMSQGGTLMAKAVTEAEAIGTSKENLAKNPKNNPVFDQTPYYNGNSTPALGRALISEQYIRPPGGSIGGLIGRAINLLGAGGEIIPMDKRVGIQATYNTSRTWHCRYGGLVAFELSGSSLSSQCDNVCGDTLDACNSSCEKSCPDGQATVDENGVVTGCKVEETWHNKPGHTSADVDCGSCGSAEAAADGDECDAAKKCREALNAAMDQVENAANEATGEVMEGLFGGRMAQVSVQCMTENHHKFRGITRYVSFNIERYLKNQEDHNPTYPTFFSAAHRKPSFMKSGALGFGDNFGSANKFKVSSMGKVGGHSIADGIYSDTNATKPEVDGYNFNYLNDADSDVSFLSAPGFHAWASSEVYYHRPGTWAEPPNLFNPYWKPKLTPVANTLGSIASVINLGDLDDKLGDLVSSVLTH